MSGSDVEFFSDVETHLNDKNPETDSYYDIQTIFDIVKIYITTEKNLQQINLDVEVIEIRDFKGMAFLKIKDDTATIASVIYKTNFKNNLESGNKIRISGHLDLYRGQVQLIIDSYIKIGSTDNSKFILLKNKLEKLGYFDNKPILENNYTSIGIISSLNAAGAKDFLHTINQRCLNKKLFIYPSAVQGKDAANELIQAIQLANNHNIVEILVLIRGGGAKEDLECFNSESLASAIYHSKIPIITGIGHQIDTSIADLVCTKSFITPTAVAQNITAENINSKNVIDKLVLNTNKKIINYLNNYYEYIVNQENKLNKYENNLVTEVENNRINYLDKANNIKKNLISRMDNKFDYIIDSEEQLNEIFSFYYANINNSLKLYENNLLVNIDKYGQIIKLYEEKYKILSHPRILDKSDNEIISIKKLIKGNTYKIYFADGIFNLKL